MVFASLFFLFVFLPSALAIYYLVPAKFRNFVLLLFSCLFYVWGAGSFIVVFLVSVLVDFGFGLWIERSPTRYKRLLVATSVTFNLAVLGYFKYSNFFVVQSNRLFSFVGLSSIPWAEVVLPIGISFFTFHKITYVVDVYRGVRPALRNPIDFGLYLALFPQLIAGPIVRFHEISDQLRGRVESVDKLREGILRFGWGLIKKVLIANPCGEIADAVFAVPSGGVDTVSAWLGVTAYTLQIYFDFSGYTDMALGLGLMFGFRLPENFNRPYSAVSVTDFWRRWHMSLTRFFRDYVYIPLGGNRAGERRTYANLMLVFVLCGMWHGANWTFLLWGAYHGFWLITERLTGVGRSKVTTSSAARRAVTLLLVMVGWVFFRATNLSQALDVLQAMVIPQFSTLPLNVEVALNGRNIVVLLVAALVVFLPDQVKGAELMMMRTRGVLSAVRVVGLMLLGLYAVGALASSIYNPFLYFRF
ncbi:MAG: MBOAT family O-acyltransferase [Nitrospirota bacterium]